MERHPQAVTAIKTWAQANSFDAAIWTALATNFHEPDKVAEPFSVETAIRYLEALYAPKLDAGRCRRIRARPAQMSRQLRGGQIGLLLSIVPVVRIPADKLVAKDADGVNAVITSAEIEAFAARMIASGKVR
ncbi:hypothetical protein [Mesorhizobium sp. M0488]|uniref:hypothetical protein n=1 Tax=unclassified Mesorhizobium TaxID=325217 RepID=UPI003335D954